MTVCGYVNRGRLGYWERRFASRPDLLQAVTPVHYLNCPDRGRVPGFVRQPVSTILIDLSRTEDELLSDAHENTRYEIKRAAREHAEFRVAQNAENFLRLYAGASRHKELPKTNIDYLDSYGDALKITEVWCGDTVFAAHIHVVDGNSSRARLIRSASVFRDMDKSIRARAGRANRFLHFQDFLHFKRFGFRWYDMGGYDPPGTAQSDELARVSEFKSGFGGNVVSEANYLSWMLHLYRRRPGFMRRRVRRAVEGA